MTCHGFQSCQGFLLVIEIRLSKLNHNNNNNDDDNKNGRS